MVGIDCDGFDVRADGELLRFDFAEPVVDAHKLRAELAALARGALPDARRERLPIVPR